MHLTGRQRIERKTSQLRNKSANNSIVMFGEIFHTEGKDSTNNFTVQIHKSNYAIFTTSSMGADYMAALGFGQTPELPLPSV
jgi:hypothetical protein